MTNPRAVRATKTLPQEIGGAATFVAVDVEVGAAVAEGGAVASII